jgi:tRNA pseudouridine65 synthase
VAKPSGELAVPGWARGEPTSMSRLRDALGHWVYPVHRLDRGTSGVLLMARDRETAKRLSELWADRRVQKAYLALVRGTPPERQLIDHPVKKGEKGPERVPAITELRRLGVSDRARCSLVELEPRTGRLHQLRRHMKHIAHPIVGDVNYGKGDVNRAFRADWDLHRLALHALRLSLPHPHTGEALELRAELPSDLADPLERLGLSAAVETAR